MSGETEQTESMTAREVADFLGLGINQLYAAAANKEVPARRVGRRWLFSRSQIMRWFAGNECGAPESE